MFTNTGMAASENGNKRVLLYLGAARRILKVETWPDTCTVQKCKFTNDQLTNDKVDSPSSFSTSNLTTTPKYASGFRFECTNQITKIRVKFTDLDTEHTVYPRMSIPVTNYVKVWDSYCKTAVNEGHASRAYIVGNEPPNGTNSNHHVYNSRDYKGIRCDSIGGFNRYSNDTDNPAYIAVFFGFRIRVCNFFVSMPDKAPANLALYMDGNEIAKVLSDAPDKVSDLLDWYNGEKDPNELVGSSFKLVWPIVHSGSNWTEAHLTRVTISYTETAMYNFNDTNVATRPIRHWKSTLGEKYLGFERFWRVEQAQHPKLLDSGTPWDNEKSAEYTKNTLCTPGMRWFPQKGALEGYGSLTGPDELIKRAGGLFFHFAEGQDINLTAFILNFPDFGEPIDNEDSSIFLNRARNSGMKLFAQSGGNKFEKVWETERVIAEFDKMQIAAGRLNLLDYRTTNYLSQIRTLRLQLEVKEMDFYENVVNSIEIFYFSEEFTSQKVWESTHRLKNSLVPLPSYIGVKDEAKLTVEDTQRIHGHTKQMMTEGFPHYWKAGDSSSRQVNVEFNGNIVMTSFIFETCRTYRKNNYRKVLLECLNENGQYEALCETPETVGTKNGKETEEFWCPGDYIEMFDHKIFKHLPYITGKKFRLSFPDEIHVAVGKISVGYMDVNDESRDSKWVPGDLDCATIVWPPRSKMLQRLNSNPFTRWESSGYSSDQLKMNFLQVKFNEVVRVKNVILGIDIKTETGTQYHPSPALDPYGRSQPNIDDLSVYRNITLRINNTRVAGTDDKFIPRDNQTHIHFFEYINLENGILDSSVYRHNVDFRRGAYDGSDVILEWEYGDRYECRASNLEIIYSKIVPSDLVLAERACLAAHNNYRLRHGLSIHSNYQLDNTGALMTSARNYAQKVLEKNMLEHSDESLRGDYGENLFLINWADYLNSSSDDSSSDDSATDDTSSDETSSDEILSDDTSRFNGLSDSDKLAFAVEAVHQWYSEYVNYDKDTGKSNGNILHDGQIEHFLQVICNKADGGYKIGIGIKSNDTSTAVCVHYEKVSRLMDTTADYIKFPSYIGAKCILTMQEEVKLKEAIAAGKEKLSEMNETEQQELLNTCNFYLKKSLEKVEYMLGEAKEEFTKIIENGYSTEEWINELTAIKRYILDKMTDAQTRTSSGLSKLTTDISKIVIPDSLAERSFRNLQLTAFFLDIIDVLGMSLLVNGATHDEAIIGGQTLNAIMNADEDALNQNGYTDGGIDYFEQEDNTDDNPEQTTNNVTAPVEISFRPLVRNCIRVMLGLFGIQTNIPPVIDEVTKKETEFVPWYKKNKEFDDAWKKITRRLFWALGPKREPIMAILRNYNGFNGNGHDMTEAYAKDCPKEIIGTDQAALAQFSHIK